MNLQGARAGNNSLPNKGPYKRKNSASFSPGDQCWTNDIFYGGNDIGGDGGIRDI